MSSGSFVNSLYEDDQGGIRVAKLQPETIATWNPAATGTANADQIRISGSKNSLGRKARYVTISRPLGAPVDGIQPTQTLTVPVMTPAAFVLLPIGTSVAYLGNNYTVVSQSGESGRGIIQ